MLKFTDIRVRSRVSDEHINRIKGKVLGHADYDVLLSGPTRVTQPNGKLICLYLPKVLGEITGPHADLLATVGGDGGQRFTASGGGTMLHGAHLSAKRVTTRTIGYMEYRGVPPNVRAQSLGVCRTTAWTGKHTEEFASMYPMFQAVGELAAQYTPEAYARQMLHVEKTPEEYVIPGTPFTTITVNNTYPTGVHTDKGDLDEGISCLTFMRRGVYEGGQLVFPQYRIAIDGQHGDLVLMDAHQWHGNVDLDLKSDDARRISLVLYYRTRMKYCPVPTP